MVDFMSELKQNILNFGYNVNFRYEGMPLHSFDRSYVVSNFELPKIEDLHLTTIQFDSTCNYSGMVVGKKDYPTNYIPNLVTFCQKIVPFLNYYKKQVAYYNFTAYEMLINDTGLILPTFPNDKRHKRGIITSLISGFIDLAYKGISSFLHYKHQKALHKAVSAMESKVDLQCNKIFHLENSMIMYGIYNSDTWELLIQTIYRYNNTTTWNEKIFAGKAHVWFKWYLSTDGVGHYAINSVLFVTTIREKYVRINECFIDQLKMYARVIRILLKGYLPILLLPPSKLHGILGKVKKALQTKNRDYDLVLKWLYFYYDMKLVTFGIDEKRNLIVQFPVFVQSFTQQQLILYQIETVPVPIRDQNEQAQSYTQFKIDKPYIALNSETYVLLWTQELSI